MKVIDLIIKLQNYHFNSSVDAIIMTEDDIDPNTEYASITDVTFDNNFNKLVIWVRNDRL